MNICPKTWTLHQKKLISLIKRSPIAHLARSYKKRTNSKEEAAWKDIASALGQTSRQCKVQWTKIKLKYAKLMILINTGKVALETAVSHPATGKYFDGLLSFLDPYISDITDDDIPFLIHKLINTMFGLKTKQPIVEPPIDNNNSQYVTHAHVKALLMERELRGDVVNNIDTKHLQTIVNMAVECKLRELLLMKNASSNPSNIIAKNDDENTVNLTMPPSKNLRVYKRKPNNTLIPSKNNQNNNEENTTKTINLGLQSELIIEDDIKIEKEDDTKSEDNDLVSSHDEDYVGMQDEEDSLTSDTNIPNKTEENCNLKNSLSRLQCVPGVHDTNVNTSRGLQENAVVVEANADNMMDNTSPVTDEYIRNFFSELGIVMSMELPLDKQRTLKSRINSLLRNTILNVRDVDSEEE